MQSTDEPRKVAYEPPASLELRLARATPLSAAYGVPIVSRFVPTLDLRPQAPTTHHEAVDAIDRSDYYRTCSAWRQAEASNLLGLAEDLQRRGFEAEIWGEGADQRLDARLTAERNIVVLVGMATTRGRPYHVMILDYRREAPYTLVPSYSTTLEGILKLVDVFLAGRRSA